MKKLILLMFFASSNILNGQNKLVDFGRAQYEVVYAHFREADDKNNVKVLYDKTILDYDLLLKNYTSYLKFNNIASSYETIKTGSMGKNHDIYGDVWTWLKRKTYTDLRSQQTIQEDASMGITEFSELTPIEWQITDEQVEINGMLCIQAEGLRPTSMPGFRPTAYTAWFTPDIPVPFGPHGISGLPGLVVKYKCSNAVVEAVEINDVSDKNYIIKFPVFKNLESQDARLKEAQKLMIEANTPRKTD